MKFAKGIMSDLKPVEPPAPLVDVSPVEPPAPVVVEKNRLFETQHENEEISRNYFRVFAIVSVLVVVIGVGVFYLTLPGVGDKVKAPRGLEDQVRDHLLIKEKRTPTDMTVYYCGKFYWAAVEVETRPDIPNTPINKVSRYRVTALQADNDTWSITATPVNGTEPDVPCG
jgi:hypothetical protein